MPVQSAAGSVFPGRWQFHGPSIPELGVYALSRLGVLFRHGCAVVCLQGMFRIMARAAPGRARWYHCSTRPSWPTTGPMVGLTGTAPRRVWRVVRESARRGVTSQTSRAGRHNRAVRELSSRARPGPPRVDKSSNRAAGRAAAGLVVLPEAVRAQTRMGARPGDRVVGAVPLRPARGRCSPACWRRRLTGMSPG
jgi:hypothetical protein